MNVEQRQHLLIELIASAPEKSDRQIGKGIGVDPRSGLPFALTIGNPNDGTVAGQKPPAPYKDATGYTPVLNPSTGQQLQTADRQPEVDREAGECAENDGLDK